MLPMSGPFRCFARSPLTTYPPIPPLISRVRAPKATSFISPAAAPSFRDSQLLRCPGVSEKRWRLTRALCFMYEEEGKKASSDAGGFEFRRVEPSQELGSDVVDDSDKHWISRVRKVVDKIFCLSSEPWVVPWTAETIVQVMLLWILSFWFVGTWIIPFLTHASGFNKNSLTLRGQALYSLLTDLAEGLAGIAILHRCLSRFYPLPQGWFIFRLRGNWHLDLHQWGCPV